MAGTLYCDDHPTTPAVALVSSLIDGSVATICGECFGPWCLAMAQALMPDAFQDIAVSATAGAAAAGEGEAAQNPPRPKRARRGRQNGSAAVPPLYEHGEEPGWQDHDQVPAELSAPASPLRDATPDDS